VTFALIEGHPPTSESCYKKRFAARVDMSDEPTPGKDHNITAEDAVRLKHSIGKSITWGKSNLNALEIEQLTDR
jgi:hypothetical protein